MALERVVGRPTWLLSRANARSQEILGAAFAAAGVRGYHYRLLAALDQYGCLSQADLGRLTGIDRKDVAIAVAELESRQLAARTADPGDARRKLVSPGPGATATLQQLDLALDQAQAEVLAPLSPQERRTLVGLLAKLTGETPVGGGHG